MSDVEASVVSGSVATFLPGVDEQTREDVLLANLYAQRVTREAFEQGLIEDWFSHYKNTLKYLGWDATPPSGVIIPGPTRKPLVEDVLKRIGMFAYAEQAQATERALRALAEDPQALALFESSARHKRVVNFQLLPCTRFSGNYIDMVLYHQTLEVAENTVGFLFGTRSRVVREEAVRVELVRFNTALFRNGKRDVVLERVSAQDRRRLLGLKL